MNIELARRIAITIGALLVFRLGSHIPVLGISTQSALRSFGAIDRVSIFALTLVPYISAAIIIRLISMVWSRLSALERSGEAGRRKIDRYTLILTLLLAMFQSYGIASALGHVPGLVDPSDSLFLVRVTASLVGGVFFLIWLSEQITLRGIGNGIAWVLSAGILAALPASVAGVLELTRAGVVSNNLAVCYAAFWVALVALMVVVESARRRVRIEFAERQVGSRLLPIRSAVLPIKLNSAGFLIPATVAQWFWLLPLAFAAVVFGAKEPWLAAAYDHMTYGKPAHMIIGAIAIFILAFIYTSYVVDPERAAHSLCKQGGAIPGVARGEATADYLDRVASLMTVIGAVYLVAVWLLPEALVAYSDYTLPNKIGGGSVLIVVCTILDLKMQVRNLSRTKSGGVRQ